VTVATARKQHSYSGEVAGLTLDSPTSGAASSSYHYRPGVAFPAWLARFNKLVTNPILRPVAARAPYFGVVVHRGRVSGRVYRTPVNVFKGDEEFVFALTYGPDRDWVRNVIRHGRFTLVHRGRSTELIEPKLQESDEAPAAIPAPAREILHRANVHTFLLARRARG
jgi:deazaflavin-dependent oxidoreductase (nitroreductase family)